MIGSSKSIDAFVWVMPNKRLQPTIASVTHLACARSAPATIAAEANVRQSKMGDEMKNGIGFRWVLILSILLVMACSDDDNTTVPVVVPDCSVVDSITVTAGSELTFSWAPNCRLMGWNIEPAGSGADQWLVLSEGSNSIEPPITYGVVPEGAREIHAAEDLVPGTEYDLYLFKWIGPGAQDGEIIKSTSFTR